MEYVVHPPARFLGLLNIAEESHEGLLAVLPLLSAAATNAYLDVGKPFGSEGCHDWLNDLLAPETWVKYPEWVIAIEARLSVLGARAIHDLDLMSPLQTERV
jgi:hypothetical protein